MKLSYVFIFNTLATLGYATGFLIIPATIMSWHGITGDIYTILMARYFGVALLSVGLVTLFARNADESKAREAITLGMMLSSFAGFVLSIQATLSGQMNSLGWLPVVVYLLIALGFDYFRLR